VGDEILSREYFMVLTALKMSLSLSPSKGGAAERRIYRMTPKDQMSHRSS
jgi:hypothetical protein